MSKDHHQIYSLFGFAALLSVLRSRKKTIHFINKIPCDRFVINLEKQIIIYLIVGNLALEQWLLLMTLKMRNHVEKVIYFKMSSFLNLIIITGGGMTLSTSSICWL
uniref:7TM_GPCR_Srx domain-containing protein n=1 Tax=Heterorhabditis bacteriophora TaxID=37862 RepID=A0A1I7WHX4_HETBA